MLVHRSHYHGDSIVGCLPVHSHTANLGHNQRGDQSGNGSDRPVLSGTDGVAAGDERAHQGQTDRAFSSGSFVSSARSGFSAMDEMRLIRWFQRVHHIDDPHHLSGPI